MYPCSTVRFRSSCPLLKSDLSSADFVIVRFPVKLFNTTNIYIVNIVDNILMLDCLVLSGPIVSEGLRKKIAECDNMFCKISLSVR